MESGGKTHADVQARVVNVTIPQGYKGVLRGTASHDSSDQWGELGRVGGYAGGTERGVVREIVTNLRMLHTADFVSRAPRSTVQTVKTLLVRKSVRQDKGGRAKERRDDKTKPTVRCWHRCLLASNTPKLQGHQALLFTEDQNKAIIDCCMLPP